MNRRPISVAKPFMPNWSAWRICLDDLLKSHGIYEDVTLEDVERDIADLDASLRT